ncbi:unnamed protein product [Allacma fusca]|uniref:Uncharacterized protein n=1 Tax=Allacma fusca TaxID=39272 RepID=A0A8J2P2M2_9HEXA|nr:unnamed protein product [Allacma fusca]
MKKSLSPPVSFQGPDWLREWLKKGISSCCSSLLSSFRRYNTSLSVCSSNLNCFTSREKKMWETVCVVAEGLLNAVCLISPFFIVGIVLVWITGYFIMDSWIKYQTNLKGSERGQLMDADQNDNNNFVRRKVPIL